MAIGSSAEIGRKFNTGAHNAWHEWVVDGEVVELGRGEWDLCYPSSPKCVYPPKGHRYFVFDQGVGATVERCYSKEHGSND